MNAKTKALIEEARKLSPDERAELVENILESLDPVDPEVDRLWAIEARDRLDAYRRGEMKANTLEEVMQKYRKP
jgi:putative addiction module component (TIGR02574 family)